MPANGALCSGWTCLQRRHSAKESGHSLESNGCLQMREHPLLVIRRKRGLWTDSAVDRDFTPLCCTITCMHLRCTEKAYSCSLEFCLGGFYNNKTAISLHSSVPPAGVCIVCLLCVLCFVFVSFRLQQNSAVINIGMHVSFSIMVSSGCMPSSGIAGNFILIF